MLKQIAAIVGLPYSEDINDPVRKLLQRIEAKMTVDVDHPDFASMVRVAESAVNTEGNLAIVSLVKQITAPPPEKVLKIKSSPKGVRIKVAAANGVRFSFGPVWNESVKKGKGIATVELNRAKLNHQAVMAGIESPEKMEVGALCAAIAATF